MSAARPLGHQHISALVGALAVLDVRRLDEWGQRLAETLSQGGRLLISGNGGSAAQAQHLAAEFTGRFAADRMAYSAIALHAESSTVTAIANDYGYEEVFARQVRAHGRPGDVLLAMSTSGRSANLLRAVATAKAGGITAWCLTGPASNPLAEACDEAVCVYPAGERALALTATVQEAHQVALHLICLSFDATVFGRDAAAPDGDAAALDGDPAALDGDATALDSEGTALDGEGTALTGGSAAQGRAAGMAFPQEVVPWQR